MHSTSIHHPHSHKPAILYLTQSPTPSLNTKRTRHITNTKTRTSPSPSTSTTSPQHSALSTIHVPPAQHWARVSSPISGLSVRCEQPNSSIEFLRIDRLSQNRLVNNIKITVSYVCEMLRKVHKRSMMRVAFHTWRVKMEYDIRFTYTNQFRYRSKVGTLMKTMFLSWKHVVTCARQGTKDQRFGVLSLYCMLYHTRRKKLKKYLQKWRMWNRRCPQLAQKAMDYWVISTYKAKLSKCNALKFVKYLMNISNDHSYRKRKSRKKYFFDVWYQKTLHFNNFNIKRKYYDQWCSCKEMLSNQADKVSDMSKRHGARRAWRVWRVSAVMTSMRSQRSERLLQLVIYSKYLLFQPFH